MTTPRHEPRTVPVFTIHDRLRKAREVAGLEQGELADRIDVARTTIGNYERGDISKPKRLVVRQWALACGVDFEWLWTGIPSTEDGPNPEVAGLPNITDRGLPTGLWDEVVADQAERAAA